MLPFKELVKSRSARQGIRCTMRLHNIFMTVKDGVQYISIDNVDTLLNIMVKKQKETNNIRYREVVKKYTKLKNDLEKELKC